MAQQRVNVHIPSQPPVLDSVRLRDIELPLPIGPDPWHRTGKPQPCTASLKLSYSSAVAAAIADDVSLSLDYGKLYRRLEEDIRHLGQRGEAPGQRMISVEGSRREEMMRNELGQDMRLTAGIIASCGLGLLDETAAGVRRMSHVHVHQGVRRGSGSGGHAGPGNFNFSPPGMSVSPIESVYGECEVWLHLPKALLRADEGLKYRSVTVWGYKQRADSTPGEADDPERCPVVLEEEFRIDGIRCYCILGVNSHERVEKQAVIISLEFKGPGQLAWGSTVVDTYQAMTRNIAERVEGTSFQTVEALATFVARIVTMEFFNERVTVTVEKPSALPFVESSGVVITRSQAFFERLEVEGGRP
ncbi:hypothetical protein EYZ11_005511 [Aspergillus tanneri]|uniref:dihydroneopterin aldolase n=1 Tax=Aspergillus tanneri TaxID=1220188 RepID=A0A4S3JHS0_9EURO|nr:uncharacterized protein ATNIH1004_007543 [Aspergillus tanneri]KAA8646117.1 hypothetical protein ATNIH1004_007543 [Aspergillus tanneri]THC94999.1 hypothetical protein EYZ11_005511 [Aspergillus tanneri]